MFAFTRAELASRRPQISPGCAMLGVRRSQPQSERSLSVAADSLLPEEGIAWKEKKDEMRQSKREKTHGMD